MENLMKHDIDIPSRLRSNRKLMLITFDEQLIQDSKVQCYSLRGGWVTMVQIPQESVYKDDVRKTMARR